MKVGNLNYEIELINDEEDKRLFYNDIYNAGITWFRDLKIYILNTMPLKKKKEVLTHEITHAYLENYALNQDNYTDENICEFVSKFGKEIVKKSEQEAEKLWKR
jgi:6-pyruvoyl-tetrahydropterin synthase